MRRRGIMDGSLSQATSSPDNSRANDVRTRVPLEGGKYSDAFLNAIHEKRVRPAGLSRLQRVGQGPMADTNLGRQP